MINTRAPDGANKNTIARLAKKMEKIENPSKLTKKKDKGPAGICMRERCNPKEEKQQTI